MLLPLRVAPAGGREGVGPLEAVAAVEAEAEARRGGDGEDWEVEEGLKATVAEEEAAKKGEGLGREEGEGCRGEAEWEGEGALLPLPPPPTRLPSLSVAVRLGVEVRL